MRRDNGLTAPTHDALQVVKHLLNVTLPRDSGKTLGMNESLSKYLPEALFFNRIFFERNLCID